MYVAAYKHVPLVERFPWERVLNNIVSSKILIETSVANKVDRFVLVLTDREMCPTNVMGTSKRDRIAGPHHER